MFCEAPADFRLASGLIDRVLRTSGPTWVADNFATPEVIRTWHPGSSGRMYFDVHALDKVAEPLRVRSRGHFNGQPGRAGAAMARKAFLIANALYRKTPGEPIDAVVVVWDVDHQQEGRQLGVLEDARNDARRWAPFKILCGFPDPESEAWVLAGFEPRDDDERKCLAELHRELGFSPVLDAVRLRDKNKGALRDIERVLSVLTGDDHDRLALCWTEPALETLRARGAETGLSAFLDEIETLLVPLLDPGGSAVRSSR
ncbi:MAG TPA: hypothetical protein VFK02_19430 [Kofleriaceae bacterium]|nr:hypothetical protein [Kofleriaceae bacterium]